MKQKFGQFFLHFFPPFLAMGYGLYLLWLYFSTKIFLFVQQDYAILSLICGIFLCFISCIEIYHQIVTKLRQGTKVSSDHNHTEDSCEVTHEGPMHLFALIIPLVLVVVITPKPLSSATAALRSDGVNTDAAYTTAPQHKLSMFDIDTTTRSIVDWVQLFTQDPAPDQYKGLKVKLDGFVLIDNSLPPGYFEVSRFVISCCAADARPVGIPVHYDPKLFHVNNNDWVEVTGTLDVQEILQERQPVVDVDTIKPIPVPENPYAN